METPSHLYICDGRLHRLRTRPDRGKMLDSRPCDSNSKLRESLAVRPGSGALEITSTSGGLRRSTANRRAIDKGPTRKNRLQMPELSHRRQSRPAPAQQE